MLFVDICNLKGGKQQQKHTYALKLTSSKIKIFLADLHDFYSFFPSLDSQSANHMKSIFICVKLMILDDSRMKSNCMTTNKQVMFKFSELSAKTMTLYAENKKKASFGKTIRSICRKLLRLTTILFEFSFKNNARIEIKAGGQ